MELNVTQQNLLDLAVAFDSICQRENIAYSLHAGTLLGAVREKGFIAWDDDMDICMFRREFVKLEEALKNDSRFHIAGNIKKQFRLKGENRFWVDIFICDYIDARPLPQKCKQLALTMLDVMNRDRHTIGLSNLSNHSFGKRMMFKAAYWFGKLLTKNCKRKLYEKVSRDWWTGNKTLCVRSNDQYKGRVVLFPACWLESFTQLPFLDTKLSVTAYYHQLLVSIYGEDYMIPKKDCRNSVVHDRIREDADFNL